MSRVAITGLGLLSALGRGLESNWNAMADGSSSLTRDRGDDGPEWMRWAGRVGEVELPSGLPREILSQTRFLNRGARLGFVAAHDALLRGRVRENTSLLNAAPSSWPPETSPRPTAWRCTRRPPAPATAVEWTWSGSTGRPSPESTHSSCSKVWPTTHSACSPRPSALKVRGRLSQVSRRRVGRPWIWHSAVFPEAGRRSRWWWAAAAG